MVEKIGIWAIIAETWGWIGIPLLFYYGVISQNGKKLNCLQGKLG